MGEPRPTSYACRAAALVAASAIHVSPVTAVDMRANVAVTRDSDQPDSSK